MTRKQIIHKLKDPRLDTVSRELLQQLLHHINTQAKLKKKQA